MFKGTIDQQGQIVKTLTRKAVNKSKNRSGHLDHGYSYNGHGEMEKRPERANMENLKHTEELGNNRECAGEKNKNKTQHNRLEVERGEGARKGGGSREREQELGEEGKRKGRNGMRGRGTDPIYMSLWPPSCRHQVIQGLINEIPSRYGRSMVMAQAFVVLAVHALCVEQLLEEQDEHASSFFLFGFGDSRRAAGHTIAPSSCCSLKRFVRVGLPLLSAVQLLNPDEHGLLYDILTQLFRLEQISEADGNDAEEQIA